MAEYDELVKRLRAAAIMSEALSIFLPHSEGSAVAKLYNEAADAIEELKHQVFLADLACKAEAAKVPRWIPITERLPHLLTLGNGSLIAVTDGVQILTSLAVKRTRPTGNSCRSRRRRKYEAYNTKTVARKGT